MTQRRARVLSVAAELPERRLTNADLEQMVDTSDEWITSRTGTGSVGSLNQARLLQPRLPCRQTLPRAG